MLVLSRKVGQQIVVALGGQEVTIEVLKNRGKGVSLGVKAPAEVAIHRREVWENIVDQSGETSGLLAASYYRIDSDKTRRRV